MTNYELYHHGILGQKWGVRRYQNADGSLTPAGKKHVSTENNQNNNSQEPKKKGLTSGQKKALVGVAAVGVAAALYATHKDKVDSFLKNGEYKNLPGKIKESKTFSDYKSAVKDKAPILKTVDELKNMRESVNSGSNYVKSIFQSEQYREKVRKGLTDAAASATVGAAAYAGKALLSGKFNREDMANYVAPNPNKKKK